MSAILAPRAPLRRARLAVVTYFALLGIANGNWLARIPALKHGLHLPDGVLGVVLLASPAGAVVAAPVAGLVINRIGSRLPTVAGGLAAAVLPVSFGVVTSRTSLVVAMFGQGVASGLLDVAMNSQAVHVQRGAGRPLMTSFHACYSFGALAGGLAGGAFAWAGVGPAADSAAVAAPLAAVGLLAVAWLPQDRPGVASVAASSRRPGRRAARAFPLLVLGLLAFCSLLGEGAADGWSAVYLRDQLGTSAGTAALGYAAFALTMSFGRLSGDRLALRFGPAAVLRVGGLLAAAGMGWVLASPGPAGAVAGFAAFGAGLSCTFPQLLSLAGESIPGRSASAIARVTGAGYAGLLCGPVLIGGLASVVGLAVALSLPALLALCLALGAGFAVPRITRDL